MDLKFKETNDNRSPICYHFEVKKRTLTLIYLFAFEYGCAW